jgi:tyrosyl-tRNA synthetase
LSKDEIATIEAGHQTDAGLRLLQKKLAQEITAFVHGALEYEKAIETTNKFILQPHCHQPKA